MQATLVFQANITLEAKVRKKCRLLIAQKMIVGKVVIVYEEATTKARRDANVWKVAPACGPILRKKQPSKL